MIRRSVKIQLFVFLVLVAQYESWKLPLAIVLILPMCLLASVTGLLMRGMPIDMGLWDLVQENKAAVIGELLRQYDPSGSDDPIYTAGRRMELREIRALACEPRCQSVAAVGKRPAQYRRRCVSHDAPRAWYRALACAPGQPRRHRAGETPNRP